jgi:thioredoxin 1
VTSRSRRLTKRLEGVDSVNDSQVLALSDANFKSEVLESDRPVLVDFWASWCPPCRKLGPTIDELARTHGDAVTIAKLDVDQNPTTAADFGISSIPAVLVFQKGREVDRIVGLQPRSRYERALAEAEAGAAG